MDRIRHLVLRGGTVGILAVVASLVIGIALVFAVGGEDLPSDDWVWSGDRERLVYQKGARTWEELRAQRESPDNESAPPGWAYKVRARLPSGEIQVPRGPSARGTELSYEFDPPLPTATEVLVGDRVLYTVR